MKKDIWSWYVFFNKELFREHKKNLLQESLSQKEPYQNKHICSKQRKKITS